MSLARPHRFTPVDGQPTAQDQWHGRAAVRALFAELALAHKPGLVSFQDRGSHDDMDASTFVRSIHALRGYFPHISHAGRQQRPFEALRQLGIAAEQDMLAATAGANAHRGAIFVLGMLCAAAGALCGLGRPVTASALRSHLRARWGDDLARHAAAVARHGPGATRGQRRTGVVSAAEEAAQGMPTLFDHVLPALRQARSCRHLPEAAAVQALFVAMSVLDDTTVLQRGGLHGLAFVRQSALSFLDAGGVSHARWADTVRALHVAFVARRLSPGGSADLLAAALFVDAIAQPEPAAAADHATRPT
jgi:triphosphoribosyl-dephospho-CoA synthase